MKKIISFILCFSFFIGLSRLCANSSAITGNFSFTDDLGRSIELCKADRVAVMIGSFADIWCLAGGKDSIVAAADDSWTSFDLALNETVFNLGAVKNPSLEKLLASNPDFVIASCNTQANLELMPILDSAHIPVAYFDVQNYDDYIHMLDICTAITGKRENYTQYGTDVINEILLAVIRQNDTHPTVLCLRATGVSCKVKNSDNLLGNMLADLGCINIADGDETLLESLSLEKILYSDPEYIFIVMQGADSSKAEAVLNSTLLSNPLWSCLTAVKNGKTYILDDSLYNLKPNANWGKAYEILADILYP